MEPRVTPPDVPATSHPAPAELSDREREILVLVASGASNKEVAQRLVISPNTVKVHLRNIFGKIGVSSRTEAALYAVRAGLVRVAVEQPADAEAELSNGAGEPAAVIPLAPSAPPLPAPARGPGWRVWALAGVLLLLGVIALTLIVPRLLPAATPTVPPPPTLAPAPTNPPRWQLRAAPPSPRVRLGAAIFGGHVYAIGGETAAGVTGLAERYDPAANTWTRLAPKPEPVADVGAAVVGGLIYVPGGRLASGDVTDVVEAYDPNLDEWTRKAPLPAALSSYALAAFEGRLYLFGGWNGAGYVASVYEYDPDGDVWLERTRMPTARGHAAVAASGGSLFVIGGTDGRGYTRAVEAYVPARDSEVANPWRAMPETPAGLSTLSAASLADTVYVTGRSESGGGFAGWEFHPERDAWQPLDLAGAGGFAPDWLATVAIQTHLYVLGSPATAGAPGQLLAYQALYTSLIPVITSGE